MSYVAIYVRVSTDEQAEHGYSIDGQKERLIAYCKSQGWDQYKLYIDDGYTGTNLNRPALKRMNRHVEEGKVHAILVYKLDRLSRKQKDVLSLLEDVFEKNNVIFKSATEPFDTSSSFGKAMIGVLAVFAQLERDLIVERTTFGRRQRVDKGKWYGGRVPFGYIQNKELDILEIVPEEARIIKQIYKLYLEGHSRLSIAEWASSRTNKRTIDHNIVMEILKRPVYVGKLRNAGKIVDGNHEAIIDQKTWDEVQAETKKRKEGTTPLGEYLLTGLLKCGVCGGPIVHVKRKSNKNGKEYLYELYACKKQHVRIKERKGTCTLGYARREKIESFVVNQIKLLSIYPEKIKEIMNRENEDDSNGFNLELLNSELKKVNTSLENLYDAIESGALKASSVSERIRRLEEQRNNLENDVDELMDNKPKKPDEKSVVTTVSQISNAWDYFTEDEEKAAIRKLIKSITIKGKAEDPEIEWFFT